MSDFEGKVAFVTGAASGIGFAISKAFAASGMKVMMADIEEGPLAKAVSEIRETNGAAEGVICDVTDVSAVKAAAEKTVEAYGKVHVLVNNAGVLVLGETGKIPLEDWRWIVDVNLMGVVYGCETFVPLMKEHGEGGYIINTASIAGHIGLAGWGPYNATKFAVVGYTESLNAELEPQGIRAAALCPGIVKTQIANSRRNHPDGQEAKVATGSTDSDNNSLVDQVEVGMSADTLGQWVLESIENNAKHIFTHPAFRPVTEVRAQGINEAWEASEKSSVIQSDPASFTIGVNTTNETE
jgi:NAD(P)-dependent dehydrogenase (short-subunit alcohol dehydrogenase family)